MWPVSEAFTAALQQQTRRWRWRIEVEWTSNATQPIATVISSGDYSPYHSPSNLVTGIPECRPYSVLDAGCKANGTWYPLPEANPFNPGWWSSTTSNSQGIFSSPPYVEIQYPPPSYRKANRVRVITTRYYPGVRRIRILYMTDTSWISLGEYEMVGHSLEVSLPSTLTLKRLKVEVLASAQGNDRARLSEVDALWTETYEGDAIYRLEVTRRLEWLAAVGYPLGTIAASDMTGQIVVGNVRTYTPYLAPNLVLRPWWGLLTSRGWEWVPQGVYLADEWVMEGQTLTVRARDRMAYMALRAFQRRLLEMSTVTQALRYIAHYAWINNYDIIVDDSVDTTTHPYLLLEGDNPAEALNNLARASGHHIWFGPDGRLRIRSRAASALPVATITDSHLLEYPDYGSLEPCSRVVVETSKPERGPTQEIASVSKEQCTGEEVVVSWKAPVISVSDVLYRGTSSARDISEWQGTVTASGGGENERALILGQPLVLKEYTAQAESGDLVRRVGIRELRVRSPIWDSGSAQTHAQRVLSHVLANKYRATLILPPAPHWEVGDRVALDSERADISGTYLVTSISLSAGDAMRVEVVGG